MQYLTTGRILWDPGRGAQNLYALRNFSNNILYHLSSTRETERGVDGMWWKIVLGIIALLVLAVTGLFAMARMADGPLGPLQGGEFTSGEVFQGEVDWLVETGGEFSCSVAHPCWWKLN